MRFGLDAVVQFGKTRGHMRMREELRLGEPDKGLSRARVLGSGVQDDQRSHIVLTGLSRIESERLVDPFDGVCRLAQTGQQISSLRYYAGVVWVER